MAKETLASQNRQLALRGYDDSRDYEYGRGIFGSIGTRMVPADTGVAFIPKDDHGGVINLDGTGNSPRWMGLDIKPMQFLAYRLCSPLAGVIDRIAQADSNGILEVINEKGQTVKNWKKIPYLQRIMTLLQRPNPLQTWSEFNSQQVVLSKIFGYCPVFAICPAGMDKSYTYMLWNINPLYMTPQLNTEFDLANPDKAKESPIKEWYLTIFGKNYTIPASDILLVKDGLIDSDIPMNGLPASKVAGLDMDISNVCVAKEADNVIIRRKGPLGVFSHDAKPDMAGPPIPMKSKEKEQLQHDLQQYGLNLTQFQYVISPTPLKFSSISFNAAELGLKETIRGGTDAICDRFDYPAELMSGKNATYENRSSAAKFLYENNIIPFSLRRMARYDKFFDIEDSGYRIILDYDHVPCLQEDIAKSGEAFKAKSEGLDILWRGGLLTFNQCLERLEEDTVEGMDIYYNEYIKKYPPPVEKTQTPKPVKAA